MQMLISMAREILKLEQIDGEWLLNPDNSIRAGTAYIALQSQKPCSIPQWLGARTTPVGFIMTIALTTAGA
jgi:hypothetical protein